MCPVTPCGSHRVKISVSSLSGIVEPAKVSIALA